MGDVSNTHTTLTSFPTWGIGVVNEVAIYCISSITEWKDTSLR